MTSIPASKLVNVTPSVLGTGGNPLALNSIFLTDDTSIPIGTVQSFSSAADVAAWFGAVSLEATLAAIYFGGFSGATSLPGKLYFAQFNTVAVAGYVRGGVLGLTLAQLQLLTGVLTVTIDGVAHTSGTINLVSATSFSNAAALITTGLGFGTCTYDSLRGAFVITSSTTGVLSTVSFATGSLSASLKFTSATGAVTSAGAAVGVAATLMSGIVNVTQNWATFMTVKEQLLAAKLEFAAWVTTQTDRYVYVCQDSDATALTTSASGSFGVLTASYDGVVPIWSAAASIAAFECGMTAAVNYAATNGRITHAFKSQAGLVAEITNATIADNLIANGYNFYGSYATANQNFTFFQPGQISGEWEWIDEYTGQIYLNSQLQLANVTLLTEVNSIPYNQPGYNLMRAAIFDPVKEALNNGTIRQGVALSAAQIAEVNFAAGVRISDTLQSEGWYLQIKDASAQVRGQRGSPPSSFWYTSGGSIQKITLASTDVL